MQIKSNTLGKLNKIRNGQVFSDEKTFVKELLQNVQRARAEQVLITVEEDTFVCVDNGKGCKADSLFTLDLTDWESTNEGFGIGFWSILAIPELTKIKVQSRNWVGTVDVSYLFATGDLTVDLEESTYFEGFKVTLVSEYFRAAKNDLKSFVEEVARYLPFNTYFNGEYVFQSDVLIDYAPSGNFSEEFSNRLYTANLAPVTSSYYSTVRLFYDNREIAQNWRVNQGISGVISIRSGKVTMKEPDRTEIVRDRLFEQFLEQIEKDKKKLYKDFIAEAGIEDSDYAPTIAEVLEVKDYAKYLTLDSDLFVQGEDEEKTESVKEEDTKIKVVPKKAVASVAKPFNAGNYTEENRSDTYTVRPREKKEKKVSSKRGNFIEKIVRIQKKAFYVNASEVEKYSNAIAEAKYAGLKVLIAKNELYHKAFEFRGIPNISCLSDSMKKTMDRTDVRIKTKKEEAFLKALQPICDEFNLPDGTFRIADLAEKTEVYLNGERVYHKANKNKAGEVTIYGMTDHVNIYLDRRALNLKDYPINAYQPTESIGVGVYKALLNALPTIAHEMAHYLYNTTDNTVEHYHAIEHLEREIAQLYM